MMYCKAAGPIWGSVIRLVRKELPDNPHARLVLTCTRKGRIGSQHDPWTPRVRVIVRVVRGEGGGEGESNGAR